MSEDTLLSTSYKHRDYVVVDITPTEVILRPVESDDGSLSTYWQEFIKGRYTLPIPEDAIPHIHITGLPAEVLSVDAYVDYTVEYPRVSVHLGDSIIDVSDRVACNHPNPETPGLYALDFTLSIGGEPASVIWRSWVSIEEPPILRQIVTPYNRSSRPVVDLNRLVIEPQFNEALYEAGVPLYNFQQSNAPSAVSQSSLLSYKNARCFVKGGRLFISGPKLPVGTEVLFNGITRTLGIGVLCVPFRQTGTYYQGDIVSYGGNDYYALVDIPKKEVPSVEDSSVTTLGSVIPGTLYEHDGISSLCWLCGAYYTTEDIGLDDGEYSLDTLWSIIDVCGYMFKMDLLRAFKIHHYWGHYNRKYFYDYAPGDIVSVVSDNIVSLYQRNDTSIDEKGLEEAYRPGHYKNPHWTEVYSASNDTMLRNPAIIPYSNAANAIVSKTYPVREEAFRIYSRLVGMPTELVDAIGTKKSVLLWALLYRTRETFPGIRTAMRAIGMDIEDLHRESPSVVYRKGTGEIIDKIYDEISAVKSIAKSIEADMLWTSYGNPNLDDSTDPRNKKALYEGIPWVRYSRDDDPVKDAVYAFDKDTRSWKVVYSFQHIGSDKSPESYDFSVNNRYYKATVHLMDRLAKDCLVDMGDGQEWIDHEYIGGLSAALSALLNYEIPIYIYFRLKIRLATIGHASVRGVSSGVILSEEWGGPIGLKLYPGKYFDYLRLSVESYFPTVLYSYKKLDDDSPDEEWTEYTDYVNGYGFRYFPFNSSVYIRLRYKPTSSGIQFIEDDTPYTWDGGNKTGIGKWISQFTIGCLGDDSSPGTGDYVPPEQGSSEFGGFKDATQMDIGKDLYLCKGMVAVTMRIQPRSMSVTAQCLQWQYKFSDDSENPEWVLDEQTPFAGWVDVPAQMTGYWSGSVEDFKTILDYVSTGSGRVPFEWSEDEPDTLLIGGNAHQTVYLWNSSGYIIGAVTFGFVDNMVLDGTDSDYLFKVKFLSD